MAKIRLINTTTPLRVDDTLESEFFRVLDPGFKTAIEGRSKDPYLDVQFVGRHDEDLASEGESARNGVPDTDVLGVYIPHHPVSHHPMIKVCPERILDACQGWNKKIGGTPPFAHRYPSLLYGVIIHELGHALMDDQLLVDGCGRMHPRSCSEVIAWVTESGGDGEWENMPISDHCCEKFLLNKINSKAHYCNTLITAHRNSISEKYPLVMQSLEEPQHIVEESLANALMLRNKKGKVSLAALSTFVDSQSEAYRIGVRWSGNIVELLKTASSWRRFKQEHIGVDGRKWVAAESATRAILTGLVNRLKVQKEVIGCFDFQKEA